VPLFFQHTIHSATKLGIWHIKEDESFFLEKVPLQQNITHPHKRLQHLAGRFLLQYLFPDFPYAEILIADTRKPFLENEAYHFSISHCGPYAAVIVSSNCRVGTDVELTTAKVEKVKHKFLSAFEQDIILQLLPIGSALEPAHLLTAAWSIKESLFKWYGNGEVNFKEHLHIDKIILKNNVGIAFCKFLKDTEIPLQVHFLFFNENCIAWVLSNVS